MPTPIWPIDLPGPAPGVQIATRPAPLRTETDSGEVKSRRRGIVQFEARSIPIEMTGAQLAIFDEFYDTTLVMGTEAFEMEDPKDYTTKTFRMIRKPPMTKVLGTPDADTCIWAGVMEVEIVP